MLKRGSCAVILLCAVLGLSACSQTKLASHYTKKVMRGSTPSVGKYKVGNPYEIKGKTYIPQETFSFTETGIASWYGPNFHGKKTANGETYDQFELTAAHKTLQMPSLVRVTNLENGRSIVVRINDRGPFHPGRVIDLSSRGADLLGFKKSGTAKVRLDVLGNESRQIAAAAKAGKDTSRIDVAGLNRSGRLPTPVARRPEPAILLNDAEALPLPTTLRPDVVRSQNKIITSEPLDLSIETIEVSELDDMTPEELENKALKAPDSEMDFLNQLDFMQETHVAGHYDDGHFVPDPVVTQQPVTSHNLYVQAGSFGDYHNAERLASRLAEYGVVNISEADINGGTFYRVRLGPMERVSEADRVLAKVIKYGQKNAQIIVE